MLEQSTVPLLIAHCQGSGCQALGYVGRGRFRLMLAFDSFFFFWFISEAQLDKPSQCFERLSATELITANYPKSKSARRSWSICTCLKLENDNQVSPGEPPSVCIFKTVSQVAVNH